MTIKSPELFMTRARAADNGEDGHRSKRMRTGEQKTMLLLKSEHNNRVTPPPRDNGKSLLDLVVEKDLDQAYHSPYKATTLSQSVASGSKSTKTNSVSRDRSYPQLMSTSSLQKADAAVQADGKGLITKINFSAAPSDPVKLAIWVARKISLFGNSNPHHDETVVEENESKCGLSSPSPDPSMQSRNGQEFTVIQRNSRRDKDNDLRSRINARAKTLWGDQPSAKKASWMEVEFQKRRNKREKKRESSGTFPGFSLDINLASELFPDQSTDLSRQIHAAGTLFLNTLQGVRNGSISLNRESAAALKSALQDSPGNWDPFIEALRVLGRSSQVINAINDALREFSEDDEPANSAQTVTELDKTSANASDGSTCDALESPCSFKQASGIRGGVVGTHDLATNIQSDDVVKALNAATNILTDIAAGTSDTYVTPYANPPASTAQNGLPAAVGSSKQAIINNDSKQKDTEIPLDRSQIDNFLKLAAGGSESDEDEDDLLPDAQGATTQKEDRATNPRPDDDVLATLQRVVNELILGVNGGENSLNTEFSRGLSNSASQSSIPASDIAREQAMALKRAFDRAGVSINTIIPASQSLATSQLYAHLSSRANRFPTSGGGINPNNASAYGNTADMTQRMLSKPGNSMQNLQVGSTVPKANVHQPVRVRNAEEMKKVQEFGFPPLPGSRPGKKRKL